MANIIQNLQIPTLIMSHNKTLAAQLATEFKYFFPKNAVHYFVSYFDYYQPESYIPNRDIYIEKESTINKEIEMFRLSTMASLLSRKDVIVVASVSSLYGLGSKDTFENNRIYFEVGNEYDFDEIKRNLLKIQYKPVLGKIEAGMFEFKGDIVDIYSSMENILYRLFFDENKLEFISIKDSMTFSDKGKLNHLNIWPATQFLQNMGNLDNILIAIENEMKERVEYFKKEGKDLEANRIQKRVLYDIRMIKETGFTTGIENYSPYFDDRKAGQAPNTIFDYFPDDFLYIIDESHMSLPQLQAMPKADRSRKLNLIDYGFRLPSAIDHRPLNFDELKTSLSWEYNEDIIQNLGLNKIKKDAKTLFVSATPGEYEISKSGDVPEQIIRPTGLLDPITYVYPKDGDYEKLISSVDKLLNKKPFIKKYLNGYSDDTTIKDILLE
ncbi:hypothetical protein [Candidatus Vampirococcus lugosii]|uniref:Excinuclease ABC subunit B n=1 Tax=Candidatus Vampirococcus lugosii TaxID=2789015 RepID=A0ABS5QKW0_9BACT|nr:hypothetical protein [Candidatus Vampirococcus lugosii]MBS8121803.1 Excinuclease ABC subunit B [Candidatus Vampirococcus lugosii]